MAKILDPLFSRGASGSLDGLCVSVSRSGFFVRGRRRPIHLRSPLATGFHREIFEYLVTVWRSKTRPELAFWESFAATYPTQNLLGLSTRKQSLNWFLKLNSTLLYYGFSEISLPPVCPEISYCPTYFCEYTTAGIELSFSPAIPSGAGIVCFQHRNLTSANIRPVPGTFSEVLTEASTSPVLISPPVDDGVGPADQPAMWNGSRVHVFLFAIDDYGRRQVECFQDVFCGS